VSNSVAGERVNAPGSRERPPVAKRVERIRQPAFWLLLLVAEAVWVGGIVYLFVALF
jgi:hypothetical protein